MAFIDPDTAEQKQFVDPDAGEEQSAVASFREFREAQPETGRFDAVQDVAAGINRAIGPFPRGVLQIGSQVLGADAVKRSLVRQDLNEQKAFEQAKQRSPIAAEIGRTGAGLVGAGLLPGGKGKLLGTAASTSAGFLKQAITRLSTSGLATGAGAGALLGGLSFKDEGESRLKDIALGGTLGASGAGIGAAAGRLIRPAAAGLKASRLRRLFKGDVPDRLPSQIDPDIPLTPSELTPESELLRGAQRRTLLTTGRAKQVEEAINARDVAVKGKFRELLRKVVPEGDDAAKDTMNQLFNKVDDIQVPLETRNKILSNPILKTAFAEAESKASFAAELKVPNSIGRLRLMKDVLDDDIGRLLRTGENKQARNLIQAKGILVKELDNLAPEFKVARAISQRLKIKENFQSGLDEIKVVGDDITPESIFKKFFADKTKRQNFLKEIEQAGVDPVAANKLINTVGLITKSKTRAILKREPGIGGAVQRFGSVFKSALLTSVEVVRKSGGKALVEVLSDPKWAKDLEKLQRAKGIEASVKQLGALLGKVEAAQQTEE